MTFQALKEKGIRFLSERRPHAFGKRFLGYVSCYEDRDIRIYQKTTRASSIEGVFGEMVVCCDNSKTNIFIYPSYKLKFSYRLKLTKKNFPGLIAGSKVDSIQVLPYMREIRPDVFIKSLRVVVITDLGQIYHNFPARARECEGVSIPGDILCFEESVVWDVPSRKRPVPYSPCKEYEVFYPNLPKECYDIHPMACEEEGFKDKYGNGGFPAVKYVEENGKRYALNRFYIPKRTPLANPFHYMGGCEKDYKVNVIATYRPNINIGVRTGIFISSDGGRTWYCKYEFGDYGDYEFKQGHENKYGGNFGNKIINKEYHKLFNAGELQIQKRTPLMTTLEQAEKRFQFGDLLGVLEIKNEEQLTIKTEKEHGLSEGNIVVLRAEKKENSADAWFVNNSATEQSVGTGIFFKVHIVDAYTLSLYEYVASADNNLCCRHIHHVNKVRDGFLIGTGEIYPNGWLLFLQAKLRDTFSRFDPEKSLNIVRLNTRSSSVQRTMGAVFEETETLKLIVASDHDTLKRPDIHLPQQQTVLDRGSTGIYIGELQDIDDFSKFKLLVDASEPCFYFDRLDGRYIFCGQRGELIVQVNNGWLHTRIEKTIISYRGNIKNGYIFNDYMIIRK